MRFIVTKLYNFIVFGYKVLSLQCGILHIISKHPDVYRGIAKCIFLKILDICMYILY